MKLARTTKNAVSVAFGQRMLYTIAAASLLLVSCLFAYGFTGPWYFVAASVASVMCLLYARSLGRDGTVPREGETPHQQRTRSYVRQNGTLHPSLRRYLAEIFLSTVVLVTVAALVEDLVVFIIAVALIIIVISIIEVFYSRKQALHEAQENRRAF